EEVEAAFRVGAAVVVVDVERRAAADVEPPGALRREVVGELGVDRDERDVVAEADLEVRPEPEVADERAHSDVRAWIERVGIDAHAGRPAEALLCARGRPSEHQAGEGDGHESEAKLHRRTLATNPGTASDLAHSSPSSARCAGPRSSRAAAARARR